MRNTKKNKAEIELDLGRYELRRNRRKVKLEKMPMELLIFLVARREQLVSREDIVTRLWRSHLFVDTESSINNIVRKIRTALGDDSAKPSFLETVVGKGYRFVGPVRVIGGQRASSYERVDYDRPDYDRPNYNQPENGSTEIARSRGAWSERTSLAVLPLFLLGNTADDHGLSLGFADALVSRLGNLERMNVLPTSAVLNIPLELKASEIASRLGVRFLVKGAMQTAKEQSRLSIEMIDTHLQHTCFARKCDLHIERLHELEDDIAKQIASVLNRPLQSQANQQRPRYSKHPLAYSEFMRGYRLSSSGDQALLTEATEALSNAVSRDPAFSLAHATLSVVFATRHFEFDPASAWMEKAEFHCGRALELDPDLPEGHVAKAFLLWGPSKNFQHLEAIAELRRALSSQSNLPHAYNRLGTILAHIGLLDHAREMYERARHFDPKKAVSHSIVQVYVWSQEYDLAREEIQAWRRENPSNKYPLYFAPQPAMAVGDWAEAQSLLEEALKLLPEEPMILSLQGLCYALMGQEDQALACMNQSCANPKSFGHAHHTYYQVASILAVLGRVKLAFEWLERSVSTGFACWPYFLKDPCLQNLRGLPQFEVLVNSLQAKYPDHLGLL